MIQVAEKIYKAAIASILPERMIKELVRVEEPTLHVGSLRFSLPPSGRIYVLGAGKAAAAMAHSIENVLGDLVHKGTVITKYGHALPLKKINVVEAAHPVPDENGIEGTRRLLAFKEELTGQDMIIFLLSGGASSLLVDVPQGSTLADVITLYDQLLKSGATIHEFNTVRKQLSKVKGGGLLRQFSPATVISLIISDVPDDDLSVIGSGPTVPDSSTPDQAKAILIKLELWERLPPSLKNAIETKIKTAGNDQQNDPKAKVSNFLLANNKTALDAAAQAAKRWGYRSYVHPFVLEGDSAQVAAHILELVSGFKKRGKTCFLFGSETTVKVRGAGKGGRCQQMVLAALSKLKNCADDLVFFAAGTDGQDGPTDAAGAVINRESIQRSKALGLDERKFLADNDSYQFFKKIGGHVITGPTYTNVMDIVIVLTA